MYQENLSKTQKLASHVSFGGNGSCFDANDGDYWDELACGLGVASVGVGGAGALISVLPGGQAAGAAIGIAGVGLGAAAGAAAAADSAFSAER